MRKIRYEFLLIAGLIMTLGCTAVFANGGKDKVKRPKNSGILSIKADQAYTVRINGEEVGMSGVNEPAEFYLRPDDQEYTVEIVGKDGKVLWVDDGVLIKKNRRYCICLKTIRTEEMLCPYYVSLEGSPLKVKPGQPVTIRAVDSLQWSGVLKYEWSLSSGTFTGQGDSIVIDTTGVREGSILVKARVNDGKWPQCEQPLEITVEIEPEIVKPYVVECDEFDDLKPDDLKARLDNCAIRVLNTPDSRLYIVIYPKSDKRGNADATFQRLYKITSQYLIKKGLSNFEIVKGRERANTHWKIWIFPPGAEYPPLD